MPTAYISLGSNLGDRAGNLLLAITRMLDAGWAVSRLSQVYETEPVETFPQPLFLNMVAQVRLDSLPQPEQMLAQLLRIEQELGRTRDVKMAPRSIDLDLLLYGSEKIEAEFLTLPHPRFHQRRFVLLPFAEIAPHVVHPILNRTVAELLAAIDDDSAVNLWRPK